MCFDVIQSHGHVSLKVTLLIIMHHMMVRSCDPKSVQYEATIKTITIVASIMSIYHVICKGKGSLIRDDNCI